MLDQIVLAFYRALAGAGCVLGPCFFWGIPITRRVRWIALGVAVFMAALV